MYWREVPYRIASVLRGLMQSQGVLSATRIPQMANDPKWGQAWCMVPNPSGSSRSIELAAERILQGKLEVFGQQVPMIDGVPDWNADPVTGRRIDQTFGLFIDFRHIGAGVDIKHVWEVNRHLWWTPLAQCYALTGDRRALHSLRTLLSSWLTACPYPLGLNWSSPVEHGIRLVNWSVVWFLIGGAASPMFEGEQGQLLLTRWLESIYQHIRFASDNYSFYSSADNHLIGEAAGVFVAAHTWDQWLETRKLRDEAKAILEEEVRRQFSADGVDLEQATCYHKFALQFLLAGGLCGTANGDRFTNEYWTRIEAAITFLASVMDCAGHVPAIGDSDDSEVWRLSHGAGFDSYRSLVAIGAALFQRDDLQAKVQSVDASEDEQVRWLACGVGPPTDASALDRLPTTFSSGGYVVIGEALHSKHEFRVTFDCGPLGYNRIAGHGHADALALLISWEGDPLLVDSGTFCYSVDPEYRRYFRGTRAHNSLVVDGQDQSDYGASFLWLRDVNTSLLEDQVQSGSHTVHACHDGYTRLADPVVHHRRIRLEMHDGPLVVEDWIDCARPHRVEVMWHAAPGARLQRSGKQWELQTEAHTLRLEFDGGVSEEEVIEGRDDPPQGWVSSGFYRRAPAPVLIARATLAPQQRLRTLIQRVRMPSQRREGCLP
ncbi:MAG: alginate lyase family protein [Burkholderiaceae bacterium]